MMIELTNGYITDENGLKSTISNKILPMKNQQYSYFLLVVSSVKETVKISIYPINHEKVLKLVLNGSSINTQTLNLLPKLFVDNIIHTSGIFNVGKTSVYEIYISIDSTQNPNFDIDLNNIRNLEGIDSVYEKWIQIL